MEPVSVEPKKERGALRRNNVNEYEGVNMDDAKYVPKGGSQED